MSIFDGVLADFNTTFINRVVEVAGKDLFPPRPFDIPVWDYPESYGYTAEDTSRVWESIKSDNKFWQNLEGYPDTTESLSRLNDVAISGHDVYFITSRPGVAAKLQTERWLKRHGYLPTPTVLISSKKGLCARALLLDKYIDDRRENVIDVAYSTGMTPPPQTYLLDRPWNRTEGSAMDRVIRISALVEMFNLSR